LTPLIFATSRGRGSWKIGSRTNRDKPIGINDSKGLRGEAAGFFPLPGGLLHSYFVSYFVAAGSPNACQRSAAAGGTGPRLRSARSTGCAGQKVHMVRALRPVRLRGERARGHRPGSGSSRATGREVHQHNRRLGGRASRDRDSGLRRLEIPRPHPGTDPPATPFDRSVACATASSPWLRCVVLRDGPRASNRGRHDGDVSGVATL